MATQLHGGRSLRLPMSRREFDALGETKHHEYYDGVCVVNPPGRRHVVASTRLTRILDDRCPDGYLAYPEWGWDTAEGLFEPDIMVAATDAPAEDLLRVPPLLVVEILSLTTRHDDLGIKRAKYAAAGAQWYWIVDPDPPAVTVLRNRGGTFTEVQHVTAGRVASVMGPFPVELDPAELTAGL